jgi:hypothetical protein
VARISATMPTFRSNPATATIKTAMLAVVSQCAVPSARGPSSTAGQRVCIASLTPARTDAALLREGIARGWLLA